MSILSAQTIRHKCQYESLILPFCERTAFMGLSFGLSPCGYDVRVEFDKEGKLEYQIMYPGAFLLASTIERFRMPKNLVGFVHDKSTWARRGIAVQNTVIEPGWEGYLTLELTNHGSKGIRIDRGVGIAQVVFHKLDEDTNQPYEGKYQTQSRGPVRALKSLTESPDL